MERKRGKSIREMSHQLPHDLQIEILVRLPVKSLLRFQCVSKSFKSLISSAGFISTHTNHHESTNNYAHLISGRFNRSENDEEKEEFRCFQFDDSFREFHKLEFPSQFHSYKCFDSFVNALECRGLILFFYPFLLEGDCFECLTLWNPAVRMNLTLPTPCNGVRVPVRGYSVHGFGFDPNTDDYKVLRIMYEYDDIFSPRVKLFKLSTGAWETVRFLDDFHYLIATWDFQAFVNGASHWLGRHSSKKELVVVLFHMFDEEFRVMKLPDVLATRYVTSSLEVSGGLLSLMCYGDVRPGNESCCIWLMKDYGVIESWTKQYILDLRDCGGLACFMNIHPRDSEELFMYDLKTNRIINHGIRNMYRLSMNAYIESLVLLNQVNAMPDQYETF
ncbi:F-box/kelch-repeat protein At3g06240-like [Corylus avellana]|uniref:F-box/kelch-repeat protein At3g06240-like n=1 Tax=Corylus avellana TaxID=13451 RepID=UPI00286B00F2|nr:F-box/kelch-repeat protein At3g06240-like [Corylus avellana]